MMMMKLKAVDAMMVLLVKKFRVPPLLYFEDEVALRLHEGGGRQGSPATTHSRQLRRNCLAPGNLSAETTTLEGRSAGWVSVLGEIRRKSVFAFVCSMTEQVINKVISDLRKGKLPEVAPDPYVPLLRCSDCDFEAYKPHKLRKHRNINHPTVKAMEKMKQAAEKKNEKNCGALPKGPNRKRKTPASDVKPGPNSKKKNNESVVLVLSQEFENLSAANTSTQDVVCDFSQDPTLEDSLANTSADSQDLLEPGASQGEDEENDEEDELLEDDDEYNDSQVLPAEQADTPQVKQECIQEDTNTEKLKDYEKRVEMLQRKVRELQNDNEDANKKVTKLEKKSKLEKELFKKATERARDASTAEIAKLLDENKKQREKIEDMKMSVKEDDRGGRQAREKERMSKTKCRYIESETGCERRKCNYFHPTIACEKFLKGSACLTHLCRYLHKRPPRASSASSSNRKRMRPEVSPNRKTSRPRIASIRDQNEKVCPDWEKKGRCRNISDREGKCYRGFHRDLKKDFRQRAAWQAGRTTSPGQKEGPSRTKPRFDSKSRR